MQQNPITQVDGKFARRQIYKQEINAVNGDYSVLEIPKLQPNKTYLFTLVLLCQDKPQYGKTINAWLNLSNTQTQVNIFIQNRNLSNATKDKAF